MNQTQLGKTDYIAISALRPSPTNPRKHFDETALAELAASIATQGIIEAILARPAFGKGQQQLAGQFEIVSGERRWRASKLARLEEIPAHIRELTDEQVLDIQMIENLQRADLHPMEEAEGYRALIRDGVNAEDVAKKTGKPVKHVAKFMRLLTLEPLAKRIFIEKHITLDHALLLARLTPAEQEKALAFLLNMRDWEHKGLATMFARLIAQLSDHISHVKIYGGRVVSATEAELKQWIESNVLLKLAGVPWDLGDASLVPEAGPCTTCPKRTGCNQALFGELTTNEDTCTDPACFETKRSAFTLLQQVRATESSSPLLKLSSKRSSDKLAAPVIEQKEGPVVMKANKPTVVTRPVVITKRPVKEGQWVEAKKGECPSTVRGIFTDGPNKGKERFVCADQACKVHKHQVYTNMQNGNGRSTSAKQETPAERERRVLEVKRYTDREVAVRVAAFQAAIDSGKVKTLEALREIVEDERHNLWLGGDVEEEQVLASIFSIDIKAATKRGNNATREAIDGFIKRADEDQLLTMCFVFRNFELFSMSSSKEQGKERQKLIDVLSKNGLPNPAAVMAKAHEEWGRANPLPAEAPQLAPPAGKKKAATKKSAKPGKPLIDNKSLAAGAGVEARG